VASMNMRGKWAEKPDGTRSINVTSAQSKTGKNRRDFSPMTEYLDGYKGYWNFESYWQSGKSWDGIDDDVVKAWWAKQKQPKRRFPNSKNMTCTHAQWEGTAPMGYVESRKKVYVPEYYNMVKGREMSAYWRNEVLGGADVVVYDFDGPRMANGTPTCVPVNKELLVEKIHDTAFPFGHGYIVASMLAGIPISEYITE